MRDFKDEAKQNLHGRSIIPIAKVEEMKLRVAVLLGVGCDRGES